MDPYEKNGDIAASYVIVYQRVNSILLVISYPNFTTTKKNPAGDLTGKTDLEIFRRKKMPSDLVGDEGGAGWR